MSDNSTTMALLAEIFPSLCGFVGGLAIGYGAIKCWIYAETHPDHYVLEKIRRAKDVPISDLRSFINGSESSDEKLVAVRGIVGTHSTKWWRWLMPPEILVSKSGVKGVALEQTNACVAITRDFQENDEGLLCVLRNLCYRYWTYEKYTSLTTVPFILTESGSPAGSQYSSGDYVSVTWNAESTQLLPHSVPLPTVYLHELFIELYPVVEPLSFLWGVGPLGMIQEKMITIGKEITVIGICSLEDGKPQIKACEDLPCFLSEVTKEHMERRITIAVENRFENALFLGLVSFCLLGLSLKCTRKFWKKWKLRSKKEDGADVDQGNGKRRSS